jgi:hypothetical protein
VVGLSAYDKESQLSFHKYLQKTKNRRKGTSVRAGNNSKNTIISTWAVFAPSDLDRTIKYQH